MLDNDSLPKGEIDLLCDEKKVISYDSFVGEDDWKMDYLDIDETPEYDNSGLQAIDTIWKDWLKSLSMAQLKIIDANNSLTGIPFPKEWMIVWRFILKMPKLRDSMAAARNGMGLMNFAYYWCIWAEQCMDKYLTPMEKEIIKLNDAGVVREEIGAIMVEKYGDEFWKPRKAKTTTTPTQVVNQYFYQKMPNSIARKELIDLAKIEYRKRKKEQKN